MGQYQLMSLWLSLRVKLPIIKQLLFLHMVVAHALDQLSLLSMSAIDMQLIGIVSALLLITEKDQRFNAQEIN